MREAAAVSILIPFVLYLLGMFAHRKQQLVNFDHTIIHLWGDVAWWLVLCGLLCDYVSPASILGCIMGHMGSKQSLSAYQILSQSGDSSAVCSGCQACCHSNWVRIDGFAPLLPCWRKSAWFESCFDYVTMWPYYNVSTARHEQSVSL